MTEQPRIADNKPVDLNAFHFPLHGNRLIEASAGTGKTYTIANLYLRLVLGHGDGHSAHPEPLSADRILVVTFTDAATAELRDRIRARLHDARMDFIAGQSGDKFIQDLINDLDRREERIALLLAAERQMDEAAVFTIHGFCQRMLKQHAFESGTLFTSELITDETSLLQQTAADFWRRHFYPVDKPLASLTRDLWKTPADLLNSIRSWLGKSNLEVIRGELPDSVESFKQTYMDSVIAVKTLWQQERQTIEDRLRSAGLKKRSKALSRLDEMSRFINGSGLQPSLGSSKDGWEIYSSEALKKDTTKAGTPPEHKVFELIDQLVARPLSIKDAWSGMIRDQALAEIRTKVSELKLRKHQMAFDDLLINLGRALDKDVNGTLANAIREQFPVAMIDEFQDTDPLQYRIFSQIYGDGNAKEAGLFMIGDPKQAIYAFRGADIFTYMQARQQVSAHYTLGMNWRSTSNMVSAVNTLFKIDNPFLFNDIPFLPVAPSPKADNSRLLLEGKPVNALQIWLQQGDEKPVVSNENYEAAMAQATANQINRLLTDANINECVIEKDGEQTPLQAGDIAVLVRTGRQGLKIRDALNEQNIACVYLSNKESVFDCQEAVDLQRLLAACLSPTDERTLRSALATPLLALSASALDQLNQNEELWEQRVEEFSRYKELWDRYGVLPMLRQLIHQNRIAERLLGSSTGGERQLTDLLHLGELLASASQEQETPHALLRWLTEHNQSPDNNADEQQLHLESERNLVKIVTIHKSKGLEYNVCFLPFACSYRETKEPVFHDLKKGRTQLDLSGDPDAADKADHERLAEDLRLMYVAMTRSVHCCYVGVAPLKKGNSGKDPVTDLHKSAFGKLLDKDTLKPSDLTARLQALDEEHAFIELSEPPLEPLPAFQPVDDNTETLAARSFSGSIEKDWWMTSYSALSKTAHSSSAQIHTSASDEQPGIDMEVQEESAAKPESPTVEHSIFTFPKGARPGTFMHTLFERLTPVNSTPEQMPQFVNEQLQLEGLGEEWCDTLVTMLTHCLDAPLDGEHMTLRSLPERARKVEMEFYLPLSELKAHKLNILLQRHDPLSAKAAPLAFSTLKGMLKGFIDLVFEYQGRWYVLDYKSNWLGEQYSDYSRARMEQMMIEHRYDLQYQLYSLALHRLLKTRLPDYSFEQHFGGVVYLFLRGVQSNDSDRHGIYDTRPKQALIEAMDNLFAGDLFAGELSTGEDE
ncbi:exodeoxyribonuclease V subunit beta [Endozoicomonas euniceicola]|uniref:RecBCD enzyme subunit RecB n=1 Tax=Endozoicomonas euniceicola TaxID=1234143 RepID=A0ABY6GUP4_9GAMM|nr:exodeoxyribonuclease V subunit beta [Endozoicomonas euniceicola]UYM16488.1 exodeoxyribonuclease V subunit beta [Endozoicomonas euniceicola]